MLSQFNPIPQLPLSAEFEQLNVSRKLDSRLGLENNNYWFLVLFLGAGFRSSKLTCKIRHDALYNEHKSINANLDALCTGIRLKVAFHEPAPEGTKLLPVVIANGNGIQKSEGLFAVVGYSILRGFNGSAVLEDLF